MRTSQQHFWRALAGVLFLAAAPALFGQSLVTGDITGTVTDATKALVVGAKMNLKNLENGSVQTAIASTGSYRFSLLKPGRYEVSASMAGFLKSERQVTVAVAEAVTADFTLELSKSVQTVEVAAVAPLINPDASNNTSFSQQEVELLPSAGGDITNILWTAPGAVANSTGGYGNFTVNGLPATSNLYTVNGENDMDPYFNINNSGASNLMLGQNELQEATVVSNAYGGQFGQLSGAQVTYVTKSGTNEFHGNAQYWWNGRVMNANDWWSNYYGSPRPFSNANQWAMSLGGPIIKNKLFFFADNEGLRFVLPNVFSTTIPTQDFVNATMANVTNLEPTEAPMYKRMFALWENAAGASNAQVIPNSSYCNALTLPGFDPTTMHCAARFSSSASALGTEWMQTIRGDYKIGTNDDIYYRWKLDHGLQPTSLNAISPAFNALSNQPEFDNQLHETHIFGPSATNSFTASLSHYVAQFAQNHAAAVAAFPYDVIDSGEVPFTGINLLRDFPQGRNITQYQFIDDFSLLKGKHSLKFGLNFRRYDTSDHNFFFNSPAAYFGYVPSGLQEMVNGYAYQYRQTDNLASDVPVAMWGMGIYAEDNWAIRKNLKLTLTLRAEHSSNPVCQFNCFANFKSDFYSLASVTSSSPGDVAYSSDIAANQHQAFPGIDTINWSPRIGFSWSPGSDNKTVISGGFGIFYDGVPEGLVNDLLANPPVAVSIRVRPATGTLPFDPAGGAATWAASAAAFSLSSSYNQISSALHALGSVFAAPAVTSFPSTMHTPETSEWNFSIQRQFGNSYALNLSYVGNHAVKIFYSNTWYNAYDPYGIFPGVAGVREAGSPLVPNYGEVTQVQNGAISRYDGLNVTLRKQMSHGITGHLNFTWAHGLDDASNGGIFTYGDSLFGQMNPLGNNFNYGNSDYDIRHELSADFVYAPVTHYSNKFVQGVVNGWQLSGKLTWRSGLPFSITDANWNGAITNGGATILAQPIGGAAGQTGSCGETAVNTPCLNASAFVDSAADSWNGYTIWPTQSRNQYRGPGFFDFDANLFKNFHITERLKFAVGVQAFNLFNHPNFGLPDSGMGDSTFGQQTGAMARTPTSAYGSFLGFDSSPRAVQLTGKITF